jgi:hypothetical protein
MVAAMAWPSRTGDAAVDGDAEFGDEAVSEPAGVRRVDRCATSFQ